MKKLNEQIFEHPDSLLFESKGQSGLSSLIALIVLVLAGIACVYFGITPEKRHYRFGVYVTLPDPNWFLFGVGIVVLLISLFVLIHYINVRFSSLRIYPFKISGNGVMQGLIHIVLPMSADISNLSETEVVKNKLICKAGERKYAFYLKENQQAAELLEALEIHNKEKTPEPSAKA